MISSIALPLLLAFTPLAIDKTAHSITFTACATDVGKGATIEFVFIGKNSDRAYEAMFVTDANIAEIAQAFDDAGIPRGKPVNSSACRFWPAGACVKMTPSPFEFVADTLVTNHPSSSLFFVGGTRNQEGEPTANTEMPAALFSTYRLDQSLLLYGDVCDQSAVYGRFVSNGKATSGKRYSFTVSWDGKSDSKAITLNIEPGKVREAIASLKGCGQELDITPSFSSQLTIAEAKAAASALAIVDSQAVKINGFKKGQFFYRAFLPDENWRDRAKRLTQPLEVRISETNVVCTIVDEDWSGEGVDPKLTPRTISLTETHNQFKGDACLFYAKAEMKLDRIFALTRQLPKNIKNWYVFID